MSCASNFASIMVMISNFSIIFTFCNFFYESFSCKCKILFHLDVILVLFLLTVTFYFSKSIIFFACSVKDSQIFLYSLPHDIKYACLLYDQMSKLLTLNICKENIVLFLLLKISLDCFHIRLFFK